MLNNVTKVWENSADPDQTAPIGPVWSGSTLCVILTVSLDTSKDSQTDLVKFYVQTGFQVPSSENVAIN